jgi:predicted metalloprotease
VTWDAEAAAIVAVELSVLEASSDFNSLYDRIHPDAHAEIPRAAVVGWFQSEFAPRGPGVSTVTGVNFVSWTWPVTGQTYPYTAEVFFTQPFADGTVVEDVVRLVQDQNGEWRWFFGRSREFVDEQIAKYVPAVPVQTQNQSIVDAVIEDIDTYWTMSFAAAGRSYVSPRVVDISQGGSSSCGYFAPNAGPGFYCSRDQAIYVSTDILGRLHQAVGDFAWITILAHEWGHHVQAIEGLSPGSGNSFELQADCLSGSYARDADTRGLFQHGDLVEAVTISVMGGDDPAAFPQDRPGAHGTSDDRLKAFMRGYLDGFIGCEFMTSPGQTMSPLPPQSPSQSDLVTLLPLQSEVPPDLGHTGDRDRSLPDVAANYTNPAETESLFRSWGWEGNVTRSYEGSGWSSGIISVYVSIHRFDSASSAVNALEYSLNDQIASTGAWEVSVAPIGETTRALATSSDITIYAQEGDVVIRLTVAAPNGDPVPAAESIMRSILGRTQ